MGGSTYSSETTREFTRSYENSSRNEIFQQTRKIHEEMNPCGVAFREARDSEAHPESVPIVVGLDVTGSMGKIPERFCKGQLGKLMDAMTSNDVADATICFIGIGDHQCDSGPLQIGQFESGSIELDKWLKNVWLEAGGGPGYTESYLLAWLFAARHTKLDSIEKRSKKGFLFTIGDEMTHRSISGTSIKRITGVQHADDVTAEQLLEEAKEKYEVFHIHMTTTNAGQSELTKENWRNLLGQNLIICNDDTAIADIIASTVRICRGQSLDDIIASVGSDTAETVREALRPIFVRRPTNIPAV